MNIKYAQSSEFLAVCKKAIEESEGHPGARTEISLKPGGYNGTIVINVLADNSLEFESDWKGDDPTRFPARIKAAATALHQCDYIGTFEISHASGRLVIRSIGHESESYENESHEGEMAGTSVLDGKSDKGLRAWSDEELKASVEAYAEMLQKHHSGQQVEKMEHYRRLAARFGRTPKAFEYRMQNISFVYAQLGRDWLPGLKPARNVGRHVVAKIETFIDEVENDSFGSGQPRLNDPYEDEVRELLKKPIPQPTGNKVPSSSTVAVTQYARDPSVKAWVLQNANGHCECCSSAAPFQTTSGLPFLEVHHVQPLAQGGADTVENAVAICPNCHRELHYGADAAARVVALYKQVSRLVKPATA